MRIAVINRWEDNFCDYDKLIDSNENEIIYITNESGSNYVKKYTDNTSPTKILNNLRDYIELNEAFEKIIKEYGKIDLLVAMSEYDILNAGRLRSDYSIPGMKYDIAKNFTDKTCMKKVLLNSNINIPTFGDLNNIGNSKFEYPLIIKPKDGNSSVGVHLIENEKQLNEVISKIKNKDNYEFEEYVDGEIYHVDGYVSNSKLKFCKPCRYINTPYQYEKEKKPLGSQLMLNDSFDKKVFIFTKNVLNNLGLKNGVFHLEFINHNGVFYFLEVGARQGGGEIVPMYKKVFSIDLINIFLKTQLMKKINVIPKQKYKSGGYLLFPVPSNAPCEVKDITVINDASTMNYQISPSINQILEKDGGYYFNSGRFLFLGDFDDVEADIYKVIDEFNIDTENKK